MAQKCFTKLVFTVGVRGGELRKNDVVAQSGSQVEARKRALGTHFVGVTESGSTPVNNLGASRGGVSCLVFANRSQAYFLVDEAAPLAPCFRSKK